MTKQKPFHPNFGQVSISYSPGSILKANPKLNVSTFLVCQIFIFGSKTTVAQFLTLDIGHI